jgi:predicted ATPase
MFLSKLKAVRYRSLCDVELGFGRLNLLIGANAAGKSNLVDALQFLAQAVRGGDLTAAIDARGGIAHLAWKGDWAQAIELQATFEEGERVFGWSMRLERVRGASFTVSEGLDEISSARPPARWLEARQGKGWWWSQQAKQRVPLDLAPTACALSAARVDPSFPARAVAELVERWGFFDPQAGSCRRAADTSESQRLEGSGRNLAARLHAIREASAERFEQIVGAARDILGVPTRIDFHVSPEGRVYFLQTEPGLAFKVHQVGASAGTLRILALVTALLGEDEASLVAIEEPENHVHPSALAAFAQHLRAASERVQVVVTTHSPLLLDAIDSPEAICIVRRTEQGTRVERESHPEAVRRALEESGLGLGELYETSGFGT